MSKCFEFRRGRNGNWFTGLIRLAACPLLNGDDQAYFSVPVELAYPGPPSFGCRPIGIGVFEYVHVAAASRDPGWRPGPLTFQYASDVTVRADLDEGMAACGGSINRPIGQNRKSS